MSTGNDPLLHVRDLKTVFRVPDGIVDAVDGVDFDIRNGEIVCLVGESGCGKSMTAHSILKILNPPGEIIGGRIDLADAAGGTIDIAAMDPFGPDIQKVRGNLIAMIFQEPMTSLSPVHTIGSQIVEKILLHHVITTGEAKDRAIAALGRVGIPDPARLFDAYTFQLSGGMRQRAMIAMALGMRPRLLIADEPTTALDVTTQATILELIRDLQADTGMSVLFITHDLGVVAEIADRVAVMYLGKIVEHGTVDQIFSEPRHPYTRALLHSLPGGGGPRRRLHSIRGGIPSPFNRPGGCTFHPRCEAFLPGVCDAQIPEPIVSPDGRQVRCHVYDADSPSPALSSPSPEPISQEPAPAAGRAERREAQSETPLLEVNGLKMHFPIYGGILRRTVGQVLAVDDVSFTLSAGQTLAIVGESGCGKTTLGRCIQRIHRPTAGEIRYRTDGNETVDIATLPRRELVPLWRDIRMIFQDPHGSLNARLPVLEIVGESLRNTGVSGSELQDRVAGLLERVGLRPEYMRRYPHSFSGGERQRISIARALAVRPRIIVADEPVSALDVSVQAQTLNLLADLQDEYGLAYIFISHDLSVVRHIADRIAVMYVGRLVEIGETETVYGSPRHPYTEALLSAAPVPDPRARTGANRIRLEGDVADPAKRPDGCAFHPRCQYAQPRCGNEAPPLADGSHRAACHFADELALSGR